MFGLRTWALGVKSLLLHPMRSALTVLGIFIGVASVIWLLAIGEGISYQAQQQIAGLGADNIIVRTVKPADPPNMGNNAIKIYQYGLKHSDFERIVSTVPTIRSTMRMREIRRKVQFGTRDPIDARIVGCTPEYLRMTHLEMDRGRFINDADLAQKHNYCVLAQRVVERLFPYENPIGRQVYFVDDEDRFTVVGVVKHRSATAAIGGSLSAQEFSNDVYIPLTTLRQRIGERIFSSRDGLQGEIIDLNQITLQVNDVDNVTATAEVVEASLAHHDDLEDVSVVVPKELLDQAETTRMMFMIMMGLIAAISLVVGGIGIMNIMLATVTERTREIGIRRALGARRVDIIWQFLVETVVLSIVGGGIGVLAGLACPPVLEWVKWLLQTYWTDAMSALPPVVTGMKPIIVPISIPAAFGIAVVVGVMFGIYPAWRAAQMDPIEALRHE